MKKRLFVIRSIAIMAAISLQGCILVYDGYGYGYDYGPSPSTVYIDTGPSYIPPPPHHHHHHHHRDHGPRIDHGPGFDHGPGGRPGHGPGGRPGHGPGGHGRR